PRRNSVHGQQWTYTQLRGSARNHLPGPHWAMVGAAARFAAGFPSRRAHSVAAAGAGIATNPERFGSRSAIRYHLLTYITRKRAMWQRPIMSRCSAREPTLGMPGARPTPRSSPDLREANLSRANLSDAMLNGSDLSDADLSGANLRRANLHAAKITGANFSRINLTEANL